MVDTIYRSGDDEQIRLGALARASELTQVYGDAIPWSAIAAGFTLSGQTIYLASRALGIFKPNQMQRGALSIRTTAPREGRVAVYLDSADADGTFVYALQGTDSNNHHNRALYDCRDNRWRLIYFYAVASGYYKAIYPCFIEEIDPASMTCRVSTAAETSVQNLQDSEAWHIERRYTLRATKVRLHQAEFRNQVLNAYGNRCAMTQLPVPELLEAIHIVPDSQERGIAGIENGICLSQIHHRAFDANLIGVTPDYKIQVSERLLGIADGPILEGGLKALHGLKMDLPKEKKDWPSQELLEIRFNEFKRWVWC